MHKICYYYTIARELASEKTRNVGKFAWRWIAISAWMPDANFIFSPMTWSGTMNDRVQRYARAILGVIVAIVVWQVLASTNLIGFSAEATATDEGKVGALPIGTAVPVIEAIFSFVIGWLFFAFQRLGDATIAGIRALVGMEQSKPVAKTNVEAVADFNSEMRDLYEAIHAQRTAAMTKAEADVSTAIKTVLADAKTKVTTNA